MAAEGRASRRSPSDGVHHEPDLRLSRLRHAAGLPSGPHVGRDRDLGVARHLESCPACQEALPSIRAEDAFVAAFCAQVHRPPPKNAVLDRLAGDLRGLLQCLPASAGEATPSADREATPAPAELSGPCTVTQPPGAGLARPTDSDAEDVCSLLAPPRQPDEMGRLGDYRVLKVLGSGGMGVVFLAEDTRLRRHVALKAMKPAVAASARRGASSLAEGAADRLHHPRPHRGRPPGRRGEGHAVAGDAAVAGREPGRPAEARGPAAAGGSAARIGRETAEGLAAVHERCLVHRDIKPANVWLETCPGSRGFSPLVPCQGARLRPGPLDDATRL